MFIGCGLLWFKERQFCGKDQAATYMFDAELISSQPLKIVKLTKIYIKLIEIGGRRQQQSLMSALSKNTTKQSYMVGIQQIITARSLTLKLIQTIVYLSRSIAEYPFFADFLQQLPNLSYTFNGFTCFGRGKRPFLTFIEAVSNCTSSNQYNRRKSMQFYTVMFLDVEKVVPAKFLWERRLNKTRLSSRRQKCMVKTAFLLWFFVLNKQVSFQMHNIYLNQQQRMQRQEMGVLAYCHTSFAQSMILGSLKHALEQSLLFFAERLQRLSPQHITLRDRLYVHGPQDHGQSITRGTIQVLGFQRAFNLSSQTKRQQLIEAQPQQVPQNNTKLIQIPSPQTKRPHITRYPPFRKPKNKKIQKDQYKQPRFRKQQFEGKHRIRTRYHGAEGLQEEEQQVRWRISYNEMQKLQRSLSAKTLQIYQADPSQKTKRPRQLAYLLSGY